MVDETEGGFKSPEERETAEQFKGKVSDVDLAHDMGKAEIPNRQEAKRIRRLEGYDPALGPEKANQEREKFAQEQEKYAAQLAEDVQKGPEGIEKETDSLIAEISRLTGLHYVYVSNRTPGVIKSLRERLGVDLNRYTLKETRENGTSVQVTSTTLSEKYNVIAHSKRGRIEEFYYNLSDPEQIRSANL